MKPLTSKDKAELIKLGWVKMSTLDVATQTAIRDLFKKK